MGAQKEYSAILRAFMAWRADHEIARDHVFTQNELKEVTAQDVEEYFNVRAYGTISPTQDDRPTKCRSSSLQHWKKAISYFMPNKNMQWNEITGFGNPTRSQAVNNMINRVKRLEVRGQGVPSQARRPLRMDEYRSLISKLRESDDLTTKYGVTALMNFQFHMIGRVDDCCGWKKENLAVHDGHPQKACRARLAWSKNVSEERVAPFQFLFGCMDFAFCTILSVGLWMETFYSRPEHRDRSFIFGWVDNKYRDNGEIDEDKTVESAKNKVYRLLKPLLKDLAEGLLDDDNKTGTHSTRKCSSTWARSNGISKDDKDYRGRWKSKRMSDRYDDIQLDWIDAKVAQVLCPGGVASYHVIDPAVTREFICQFVTPNIAEVFGIELAFLFGKAILWLAYSEHKELLLPQWLDRITTAYEDTRTIEDDAKPIEKRLVIVTGQEAQVFMEEVVVQNNNQDGTAPTPTTQERNDQATIALTSQVVALRQSVLAQSNTIENLRGTIVQQGRSINALVRRMDANPVNMMRNAAAPNNRVNTTNLRNIGGHVTSHAVLMDRPTSLQQLWDEYIRGIGLNKPAKDFTPAERGHKKVKFKYSRRLNFWTMMSLLVSRGFSSQESMDMIYAHYGASKSPTAIIDAIRKDKNQNTLPFNLDQRPFMRGQH